MFVIVVRWWSSCCPSCWHDLKVLNPTNAMESNLHPNTHLFVSLSLQYILTPGGPPNHCGRRRNRRSRRSRGRKLPLPCLAIHATKTVVLPYRATIGPLALSTSPRLSTVGDLRCVAGGIVPTTNYQLPTHVLLHHKTAVSSLRVCLSFVLSFLLSYTF